MTNFDRVRSMSIQEFISLFEFKDCIIRIGDETVKCPYFDDRNECTCENGLREWLYQEVNKNAGTNTAEQKP